MTQNLKNILAGFLVSFIGSIPLGYLNVVGFQIYQESGVQPTIYYLLGVICVEFLMIYFTLTFAKKITNNKRLSKYIEVFSVVFMFVLAFVFYFSSNTKTDYVTSFRYIPFVLGLVLSSLNFIQIPFWTGWNLYLLNKNYIEISDYKKYFYLLGTVTGTFFGMLGLVLSLNYFASNVEFLSNYLMKFIIPAVFLGLGFFQGYKFYRK